MKRGRGASGEECGCADGVVGVRGVTSEGGLLKEGVMVGGSCCAAGATTPRSVIPFPK